MLSDEQLEKLHNYRESETSELARQLESRVQERIRKDIENIASSNRKIGRMEVLSWIGLVAMCIYIGSTLANWIYPM